MFMFYFFRYEIYHLPGDLPGVFFPLKFTEEFFCGVLFVADAVIDVLNTELYEIDIFDVLFMLAFNVVADEFNFFCHLGNGPRVISPSIVNALLISFI